MRKSRLKHPAAQKPRAVADLLRGAIKTAGIQSRLRQYEAFPYWEDLVGERLARVARPVKIVRGRLLVIEVADAVWSQELSLMKPQLLEKLHALCLGAIIEDIKLVTGNPRSSKQPS